MSYNYFDCGGPEWTTQNVGSKLREGVRRLSLSLARVMLHTGDESNLSFMATMSNDTKETPTGNDLLRNSSLYREFQAEREEILKHKWIESEKAGRDIGFEQALTDWIVKHRSKWRKNRHSSVSQ